MGHPAGNDVDAAFMQLELHERGIHIISTARS
jgi:hypothetical protein